MRSAALVWFAVAGCTNSSSLPALVAIEPSNVAPEVATPAVVHGERLFGEVQFDLDSEGAGSIDRAWAVRIDDTLLAADSVTWVGPAQIDVIVPAGLALGTHDVVAIAPNGYEASLPGGLRVGGPDPGVCLGPSAICVDPGTLRTCTGAGAEPLDTTCRWSCQSGRCGELVPAGGGVGPADLAVDPSLGDVTLPDRTIINSNGSISSVSSGFAYSVVDGVAIFRFKTLTVASGGPGITVVGTLPVALVARGAFAINGVIDARGPCVASIAGPGGFAGGFSAAAPGPGGGGGGNGNDDGGAGGGHGGRGGTGNLTTNGPTFGDPSITKLTGGGGGGGGRNGAGGGGGGGLQLVSDEQIVIASGAGINAGGCGGRADAGAPQDGGGGGGAGGTILLEAPRVVIDGILAANGGGGGSSDFDGQPGNLGVMPAVGGGGSGGAGGAGSMIDGTNHTGPGTGGGGGVGRIRINTRLGTSTAGAGAIISPNASEAAARVQ